MDLISEASQAFNMILMEIAAVLAVLVFAFLFLHIRNSTKDKRAMKSLVKHIKAKESARKDTLSAMLKDIDADLSDKEVETMIKAFTRPEQAFYRNLVDTFFKKKGEKLVDAHQWLEKVTEPYKELLKQAKGMSDEEVATLVGDAEEKINQKVRELEKTVNTLIKEKTALQNENERLQKSLENAESELDQLTNEYTSAFNKEQKQKEAAAAAAAGGSVAAASAAVASEASDNIQAPEPEELTAPPPPEPEAPALEPEHDPLDDVLADALPTLESLGLDDDLSAPFDDK